ncbi:MAG: GntR family transcriptional regulator [Clostridiaceae bacterium BRH_c20a]|nr:MAG: GntR family transcriptional regulator [Clostridiaceae bacterium BRH_c20a]
MYEEMSIDKNSVIPIYYQLAKLFEGKIQRGELKPGEAMPTEMKIVADFGVSRMTVRKAIAELVAKGMVHAQQGKGTYVSYPKLDNVVFELNNFDEDIKRKGIQYKTTLIEAKIIKADEGLRKIFKINDPNFRLLHFRSVISAEDEKLAYEVKYTIYTKNKPILEFELQDPNLPNLITANTDYLPMSSKKVLQAVISSKDDASILGIGLNLPLLVVEQTIYDGQLKPVGWSKSVYRGDRYKLTSNDGWCKED